MARKDVKVFALEPSLRARYPHAGQFFNSGSNDSLYFLELLWTCPADIVPDERVHS